MYKHVILCAIAALFTTPGVGQTPVPFSTYTLHAQKEPRPWSLVDTVAPPSSVLAITPNNDLLVLIPQPDKKWVLKRVSGWDRKVPQEQTLAIDSHEIREDDISVTADLTVNPSGSYVIVRINSHRGRFLEQQNLESVLIVVDLRTFAAVSRRVTTDPLIASSQWRFNQQGLLITKGLAKRLREKMPKLLTVTETYEAATLTVPDLAPSNACQYNVVRELPDESNGWTEQTDKGANVACASVLGAANVSSVDALPGAADPDLERITKRVNFKGWLVDISKDEKFALYSHVAGKPAAWDTVKTTAREAVVLSVADSKTIFSLPLPFKQPIAAALATASNQDYLLLLRDGIKLETYRLP